MQLKSQLREQRDSHQQQLASFLTTNASLREKKQPYVMPPRPLPFFTQTSPPIIKMAHSTSKALHSPSPRTTSLHPATTHGAVGASCGRSGHPCPTQAWTPRFGHWTITRRTSSNSQGSNGGKVKGKRSRHNREPSRSGRGGLRSCFRA